jgi:hypothetical protein
MNRVMSGTTWRAYGAIGALADEMVAVPAIIAPGGEPIALAATARRSTMTRVMTPRRSFW